MVEFCACVNSVNAREDLFVLAGPRFVIHSIVMPKSKTSATSTSTKTAPTPRGRGRGNVSIVNPALPSTSQFEGTTLNLPADPTSQMVSLFLEFLTGRVEEQIANQQPTSSAPTPPLTSAHVPAIQPQPTISVKRYLQSSHHCNFGLGVTSA